MFLEKENSGRESYSQFAKFCIGKSPQPANYLLFLFLLSPYFTSDLQQSEMLKQGLKPLSVIEPYGFGVKSLTRSHLKNSLINFADGTTRRTNRRTMGVD